MLYIVIPRTQCCGRCAGDLGQKAPPEGRSVARPAGVLERIYLGSELGFPTDFICEQATTYTRDKAFVAERTFSLIRKTRNFQGSASFAVFACCLFSYWQLLQSPGCSLFTGSAYQVTDVLADFASLPPPPPPC